MNLYPGQIRAVLVYLDALNEADKKVAELKEDYAPFPERIKLVDQDSGDWGTLQDEIGGSWSWTPPDSNTESKP